jgi:hypothetical protein
LAEEAKVEIKSKGNVSEIEIIDAEGSDEGE